MEIGGDKDGDNYVEENVSTNRGILRIEVE